MSTSETLVTIIKGKMITTQLLRTSCDKWTTHRLQLMQMTAVSGTDKMQVAQGTNWAERKITNPKTGVWLILTIKVDLSKLQIRLNWIDPQIFRTKKDLMKNHLEFVISKNRSLLLSLLLKKKSCLFNS